MMSGHLLPPSLKTLVWLVCQSLQILCITSLVTKQALWSRVSLFDLFAEYLV